MTSRGDAAAARARECVGIPYRPQGRSRSGLDCAGLAAAAFALPAERVPRAFGAVSEEMLAEQLTACGLTRDESGDVAPGDLVVFAAGARRLHLAVATDGAFVHADAGLRRVVERPFPAPWRIEAVWRLVGADAREDGPWPPSS